MISHPATRFALIVNYAFLWAVFSFNCFESRVLFLYGYDLRVRMIGIGPCIISWLMTRSPSFKQVPRPLRIIFIMASLMITSLEVANMVGLPR